MFLFESIPWYSWAMFVVVIGALMLLNEGARRNKWFALFCFVVLPIVLPFAVWKNTATAEGSTVGSWFHWVKVYSALAGCLGFMALRFVKKWEKNTFLLAFPAIILSVNILEAVIRDFQVFSFTNQFVDGMWLTGGPWNIMNGVAGILNIITISGWLGIVISKDKYRDMVWPDQLWFWIIAYDIWNFAYVYNCVPEHAFYAGAALLLSCTIPAFFIKKGAWLQHRAQTLAFWMMFVMTFPTFVDTSMFAVKSSHSEAALWTVSGLSLAINVAVFVYHFYKIIKFKRNPFKDEIHSDLNAYKELVHENNGRNSSGKLAGTI